MPAQVFTNKMLDYVRQRMKAIAEDNTLLTYQLNSLNPDQLSQELVLIDSMIDQLNAAIAGLDATYDALKANELARLTVELDEVIEFKTRLQNINS